MPVLTKPAVQVWNPVDATSNPRGSDMSEEQRWGMEIEEAVDFGGKIAGLVFSDVALLLASSKPAQGVGSIWQAGEFFYREALTNASDHHVVTSGGVKLYAIIQNSYANLTQFGAIDDGFFNCAPALVSAKLAAGLNGTIRIRKLASGRYYFGAGGADLSGAVIDADEGVVVSGFVNLATDIQIKNPPLRVDYDADIKFTYWVGARPNARRKPAISQISDAPRVKRELVTLAMWNAEQTLANGTSDVWNTDVGALSSDAAASWPLTNNGQLRAQFVSVWGKIGFRELTWSWDSVLPTNAGIGVAVRCSNGWMAITCFGDANTMDVVRKPFGSAATTEVIPSWYGRADNQSWLPRTSIWSIRPISPYDFHLALNGVVVGKFNTAALGWIMEQGPAAYGNVVGPVTIIAARATIEDASKTTLTQRVGMLCIGDSKMDAVNEAGSAARYPVSAFDHTCSLIDGAGGVRVTHAVNIAVAGDTSAQQLARLTTFLSTPAANNITHAVIAVGTNDIQANTASTSVYNSIGSMIDALFTRNIACVLVIPDEFYSRSLGASATGQTLQGQNVSTYQIGAPIRTVMRQLAVQKSVSGYEVGVVDATRTIGLELSDWLTGNFYTQPRLADNIHGDGNLWAAEIGYAVANESMRLIRPPVLSDTTLLPFPINLVSAGFSIFGSMTLSYQNGRCDIEGGMTKTAANWSGTIPFTIPRCFRPQRASRHMVEDFAGVFGIGNLYGTGASFGQFQAFINSTSANLAIKADWVVR